MEDKMTLKCDKCHKTYHFPIERNWALRNLFFFLPIKPYFCSGCNQVHYVWMSEEQAAGYERI